jgi:hypothetical protein
MKARNREAPTATSFPTKLMPNNVTLTGKETRRPSRPPAAMMTSCLGERVNPANGTDFFSQNESSRHQMTSTITNEYY